MLLALGLVVPGSVILLDDFKCHENTKVVVILNLTCNDNYKNILIQ